MIEVDLPDGSVAEFPDGTPPDVMKKAIQKRFPVKQGVGSIGPAAVAQEPASAMERAGGAVLGAAGPTGEDMTRSAATGLREGVEGIVGGGGDIRDMLNSAVKYWLGDKTAQTLGDAAVNAFPLAEMLRSAPTSADVHSATEPLVQSAGAGDVLSHTPQTTAGEYARTVGQFVPGMMMPGGGSIGRRALTTAASAFGSETAGQVTKGTDYEPLARVVGAVLGGGAVAGRGPNMVKAAAKGAPSEGTLTEQTNALYNGLRKAGIRYDSEAFQNMAANLHDKLKEGNVRPIGKLKEAFDWADEVGKLSQTQLDFDDINSMRSSLGEAARDAAKSPEGKSLARAINIVGRQLDKFEQSAPLTTSEPVPRELLDKARTVARELALRNIKQRAINEIVKNADTYEAGKDAGIRNGIGNLLRSKRGQNLFNEQERKALLDVKQGRKGLRTLSKFGFDFSKLASGATFMPTVGAGAMGSIAAGLGLPVAPIIGGMAAAGTAAKYALPRLTSGALDEAGAAIRSGKLNDPDFLRTMHPPLLERAAPLLLPSALAAHPR